MTDLRKLLDEATPGPWVYPAQKWARDACIEASGDAVACPGTGGAMSYSQDICTMTWRGTPEWDANARLIALAPSLAAALIKAEEALVEATEIVHKEYVRATLEAVNAGPSHPLQKQADAWRIRCMKSEASSRVALAEIRALTGGNDD